MSGRVARILVDTTPWLYYILGDSRLKASMRDQIDSSAKHGKLFLSAASIAECAEMIATGQLTLQQQGEKWLQNALSQSKVQVVAIDETIAFDSEQLPKAPTGLSSYEKIILATARNHNISVLSMRSAFTSYALTGFVKVKS